MPGRLFDLPKKKRKIGELLATLFFLSPSAFLLSLPCLPEHLISADNIYQVCELIHRSTAGNKCHCEDV